MVKDKKLHTPPLHASVLPGITRNSVVQIAKDLGYEVLETSFLREFLYIADEVFFTGSAAEITPIGTIDKIKVGTGGVGEITKKLQKEFFAIINGEKEDRYNWLTHVK